MTGNEREEYFKSFVEKNGEKLVSEGSAICDFGFSETYESLPTEGYHVFEKQMKLVEVDNSNANHHVKCVIRLFGDENSYDNYHVKVTARKIVSLKECDERTLLDDGSSLASGAIRSCMNRIAEEMRVYGLVQLTGKDLVDLTGLKTEDEMDKAIENRMDEIVSNRYHLIVPEHEAERFAWEDMRRFYNEKTHYFNTSKQVR